MTSSSDSSSATSSSISGDSFCAFCLRKEGFYSVGLSILPWMSRKDRILASSFRNSLPQERIREIVLSFFVPPEVKIAIPRSGDDVLYSPIRFCSVYVDHLKASL